MNMTRQVIILSAENDNNSYEKNRQLTLNLAGCLKDCNLQFRHLNIINNGNEKDGFVVIINNEIEYNTVKDLAFKNFNQENIFYQDSNQEGYILNKYKSVEQEGRLKEVSNKNLKDLNNYFLLDGKIYSINKS